jgi:hypothetical protein
MRWRTSGRRGPRDLVGIKAAADAYCAAPSSAATGRNAVLKVGNIEIDSNNSVRHPSRARGRFSDHHYRIGGLDIALQKTADPGCCGKPFAHNLRCPPASPNTDPAVYQMHDFPESFVSNIRVGPKCDVSHT